MSDEIWVAVIEAAPAVMTVVLVGVILVVFRQPLSGKIRGANRIAFAGFEIETAVVELKNARPQAPVSDLVARTLARRTQVLAEDLVGLRILWVDDIPHGNTHERRYFRSTGMTVVNALDTDAALDELRRDDFDLVITDFRRGNGSDDGTQLVRRAREEGHEQPFVAYIGEVDPSLPVPEGFFRVTDRPDDLVGAILAFAAARA